nr:hypothetical protein [Nannocystis sp.]
MADQFGDPAGLFGRVRAGAHAGDSEPAGCTETLGLGLSATTSTEGVEALVGEHLRRIDGGVGAAPSPTDFHRREAEDLATLDDVLDSVVLGRGDEDAVRGFDALVGELGETTLDRRDHLGLPCARRPLDQTNIGGVERTLDRLDLTLGRAGVAEALAYALAHRVAAWHPRGRCRLALHQQAELRERAVAGA